MIPSREDVLKKFIEDYKNAISKMIVADKKSFEQYGPNLHELKVAGDDISARLIFLISVENPKGIFGAEIAILFKNKDDEMHDFTTAYIDLKRKKANEVVFSEAYLPQDLAEVKKIKVSVTNLITEEVEMIEEEV